MLQLNLASKYERRYQRLANRNQPASPLLLLHYKQQSSSVDLCPWPLAVKPVKYKETRSYTIKTCAEQQGTTVKITTEIELLSTICACQIGKERFTLASSSGCIAPLMSCLLARINSDAPISFWTTASKMESPMYDHMHTIDLLYRRGHTDKGRLFEYKIVCPRHKIT